MGYLGNIPNRAAFPESSFPFTGSKKGSHLLKRNEPKAKMPTPGGENYSPMPGRAGEKKLSQELIAKKCPPGESPPSINRVAKRMGLLPGKGPTVGEVKGFIEGKSEELLLSLSGKGGYSELPGGEEGVRKIVKTAVKHQLFGSTDSGSRRLQVGGEEYLLVEKRQGRRLTLLHLTEEPLGKGKFAAVEKVVELSSKRIFAFKSARSYSTGDHPGMSEEAIKKREKVAEGKVRRGFEMVQKIHELGRKRAIEPKNLRFIEQPPLAWVKSKGGREGSIASELYMKGSLSIRKESMAEKERIKAAEGVLKGLGVLNDIGVRWGDGKAENICIESSSQEVRLTDFDGCNFYSDLQMPSLEELAEEAETYGERCSPETLMGVDYTEEYLPKEHMELLISAVEEQDKKRYLEAHRQIELFNHAALLFELLTGHTITDLKATPLREVAIKDGERAANIEKTIRGIDSGEIYKKIDSAEEDICLLGSIEIEGETFDISAELDEDSGEIIIWAPDNRGDYGENSYKKNSDGAWVTHSAKLFSSDAERMTLYPDGPDGDILRFEYLNYLFDPTGPTTDSEKELVEEFKELFTLAAKPDPSSSIEISLFLKRADGLLERLKALRGLNS